MLNNLNSYNFFQNNNAGLPQVRKSQEQMGVFVKIQQKSGN